MNAHIRTDELIATLEAQTKSTLDKLDRATSYRGTREAVGRLRGQATVGHTSATVDATGLLVSIHFAEGVQGLDPAELGEQVMQAVHSAQLDAADVVGLVR